MILVFIEIEDGKVSLTSLETLVFARPLARALNCPVGGIMFDFQTDKQARHHVSNFGLSKVYTVQHPQLKTYAPTAWGKSISQVISKARPHCVLAAGTHRGNEIMAHVGAFLKLSVATQCVEINRIDPFTLSRLRWGGSLLEEAILKGRPKLLTVARQAVGEKTSTVPEDSEQSKTLLTPPFVPFTAQLDERDFLVQIQEFKEKSENGMSLTSAPVVVAGGRGVGGEEGFEILEELASLLEGAVGASRVATNNSWRPHSDQIGLTGARISPDLYIACGISGAIQHLVGCKGADKILVINKDPEAPFFSRADYGVVGDLYEIIPAVIEAIKKRKLDA